MSRFVSLTLSNGTQVHFNLSALHSFRFQRREGDKLGYLYLEYLDNDPIRYEIAEEEWQWFVKQAYK